MITPSRFLNAAAAAAAAATVATVFLSPCGCSSASAQAPPDPLREFRAAWIAVVHNIDWPSRPGLSAGRQRAELISILDRARALNLNAVILQVRPACDAIYPSRKEPWCRFLTGKPGLPPDDNYDPLLFAVTEAHRRGLELHAWFNPFRALASPNESASADHVTKRRPNWIRRFENKVWIDPGLPEARDYTLDVILDVVRRYDIDGVHIDDYFYPYPANPKKRPIPEFPDAAAYERYGRGLNRGDWRRKNMDEFVSSLYRAVKKEKSWVKFGISPFGIWRPQNPPGIVADLDAYTMIYADARKWLANGWCDYLSPQLYWRIAPPDQSFSALAAWWAAQNRSGRHLWPGIATSRIQSSEDPGRPASEIVRQIEVCRRVIPEGRSGHSHWSVKALMQNRGGISQQLQSVYATKAAVPASPWLSRGRPPQPSLATSRSGAGVRLEWKAGNRTVRWWIVQIQPAPGAPWRAADILWRDQTSITLNPAPHAVALRAVDAFGNASDAAIAGARQ